MQYGVLNFLRDRWATLRSCLTYLLPEKQYRLSACLLETMLMMCGEATLSILVI